MRDWKSWWGAAALVAPWACAHAQTDAERVDLDVWRPAPISTSEAAPTDIDDLAVEARRIEALSGDLGRFAAYALQRSPALRAAYDEWRSAVEGAVVAAGLPEPEIGYGGFVRAVETRVGPQRHRISLKQALPWPGRLDAATDARAAEAAAEGAAFRARVLDLVRDVAATYWALWRVERSHEIRLDHERVLEGLVATIQARVETAEKPIAELLQVQLRLQSLRDHRTRHRSEIRQYQARLLAAVGADPSLEVRTTATEPPVELPAQTMTALRARVRENPLVTRWNEVETARRAHAREARLDGRPGFRVGADYIVTDEARVAGIEDSGKDPVVLSLGLTVPLWFERYGREARAAEARASAARASGRAAWLAAAADLESVVARLHETHERITRYQATLIPQAEALQRSVSAAYEVGRAGVSAVLLALADELELRLELASARALHAMQWAELERLTGRVLERAPLGGDS